MPESGDQNYWQSKPTPAPSEPVAEAQPVQQTQDAVPAATPAEEPLEPKEVAGRPEIRVEWEAPEFIEHPKGVLWFLGFAFFAVMVLGASIFLLKDWFVTVGAVIMVVAVMTIALRRPRIVQYKLDNDGVQVGERLYLYAEFQAFALQQEGTVWNVVFTPAARFKPALLIYFHQEQGETIVDALGQHLPMEEHKTDLFDRLSSKIRF